MTTVEQLAERVCVDAGDIRVIVDQLAAAGMDGIDGDHLSKAVTNEVDKILQPHCERTVPAAYGARGTDV